MFVMLKRKNILLIGCVCVCAVKYKLKMYLLYV